MINKDKINWRLPDRYGLSERVLDCKQLCIKEALEARGGVQDLLNVFLNPLDCFANNLQLRRSEPEIYGWNINKVNTNEYEIKADIENILQKYGSCFINYHAKTMPYSTYFQRYDVTHWALIINMTPDGLYIVDDTGNSDIFTNNIGYFSWNSFIEHWKKVKYGSLSFLTKNNEEYLNLNERFPNLIQSTVVKMQGSGLDSLKDFITYIEKVNIDTLLENIEQLEFDVNYFKKLRELWLLLVQLKKIPVQYKSSEWIEDLTYLCKGWSLILGVIMKWKRQPERDYKEKLVNYLWETYNLEKSFIGELSILIRQGDRNDKLSN